MEGIPGTATQPLLEVKCHHPFSDPLESLLNSTFQGFCRTVLFSRIFVAHVWTSAFCWSPVFLWRCSQFATSQMGNGWTRCLAPTWYSLPKLVSGSAHQPYTALGFFNPKLFTCLFWFDNISDLFFFCFQFFFPLHSWRCTTCRFFSMFPSGLN